MVTQTPNRPRGRTAKLPDSVDLGRLCLAVERDRRELLPFRRNRLEMVRQYLGGRYGDNAAAAEVPVNFLGEYVDVILPAVVDNAPRVMLSTFDDAGRPVVEAMQAWVNDELVRMNVEKTYRRCLFDSLFLMGIAKVGIATPADAAASAWDVEAGQPFIESVDFEDFAWDTTSRSFDRCSYHACKYSIETSLANELYAKGRAEKFEPTDPDDINAGGDERMHTLAVSVGRKERLFDMTDLWECFIPQHKIVVTLRDSGGLPDPARGPVRVQPWVGPAAGPYHILALGDGLPPKAPVMDLIDLHRAMNGTYRKLLRRTRDSKIVTFFDSTGTDDAERALKAPDGAMIQGRVEAFKQLETGGPTRDLVVMFDHMSGQANRRGGNLEVLGGRSTQARTASQEKQLNDNAQAGVGAIAGAFNKFCQGTVEALLWYFHYHPTKVMESHWSPASMPDLRVARRVTPAMRRGTPPHLKIDVYSLPRATPQSRLAFINQTLTTLAPFAQLAAQQGKLPNLDELLALYAKYGNEPDLAKIYNITAQLDPGNGGSTGPGDQGGGAKPAQTTRTYERISSGGQGPQAQKQQLNLAVANMSGPANPNAYQGAA